MTVNPRRLSGRSPLLSEPARGSRCVADGLIEISISRDVLLLARVNEPALPRGLFDLACRYLGGRLPAQRIVSAIASER